MSLMALLEGQPYLNFINSLKSGETKAQYRRMLQRFLIHTKIPNIVDLLSLPPKDIEQLVINYITNLNARGLSSGYINLAMAAIFHLTDMNDVLLNKRKISKFQGEHKRGNKDRAYMHEEIKLLVDTGDFRFKALILLLSSTGIRLGSVPSLLVHHLEKKGDVYKVTIYENTKEEHYVFTTPETATAIDQYLDYRRRASETITPLSPLFRNDFNINSIATVRKNSKPITYHTLKCIIRSRLIKAGIIDKSEFSIQKKHEVPMSHGFRKFWMTQAVNAKINPEIREMLLNHKIGIASSYYRPTEEDMRLEAEKLIDALTIDPSQRLQRKVEKLEIEKSQYDKLAADIAALKKKIK
jgi:integrase